MKLSKFKQLLSEVDVLEFENVAPHFHITEVGLTSKQFLDCGGKAHIVNKVNFQLWVANDVDHRLSPNKLLKVIEQSEKELELIEDVEIQIEYQQNTVGQYELGYAEGKFQLLPTKTACLAPEKCNLPQKVAKCCGGGCC